MLQKAYFMPNVDKTIKRNIVFHGLEGKWLFLVLCTLWDSEKDIQTVPLF